MSRCHGREGHPAEVIHASHGVPRFGASRLTGGPGGVRTSGTATCRPDHPDPPAGDKARMFPDWWKRAWTTALGKGAYTRSLIQTASEWRRREGESLLGERPGDRPTSVGRFGHHNAFRTRPPEPVLLAAEPARLSEAESSGPYRPSRRRSVSRRPPRPIGPGVQATSSQLPENGEDLIDLDDRPSVPLAAGVPTGASSCGGPVGAGGSVAHRSVSFPRRGLTPGGGSG